MYMISAFLGQDSHHAKFKTLYAIQKVNNQLFIQLKLKLSIDEKIVHSFHALGGSVS